MTFASKDDHYLLQTNIMSGTHGYTCSYFLVLNRYIPYGKMIPHDGLREKKLADKSCL